MFFFLKISDRYVLSELLKPFFAGVVAFMIIMISNTLYIFAELIVKSNAGIDVVLKMILYSLPAIIVVTLPVAYMFATLLALGRLGRDSEIIALRACGVSLSRIVAPVIGLSLIISAFGFYIQEKTVPWANLQTIEVLKDMMRRDPLKAVKPKVFLAAGDRNFFVNDIDREKGELKEVYVLDQSASQYPQVIAAQRATRDKNTWNLNDGILRKIEGNGFIDHEIKFKSMEIQMEIKPDMVFNNQADVRSLSSSDAKKLIEDKKAGGQDTKKDELDYHTKFSLPLATFFTILLAAPIGIMFSKMGNYFGVAISIALVFVWYMTYSIFTNLGSAGTVPPLLAAWVQNIAFGSIGLLLLLELSGVKVHRLVTAPFGFVEWRAPVSAMVPPRPAPLEPVLQIETEEEPTEEIEQISQERAHTPFSLLSQAVRRPYIHLNRREFVLGHLMVFILIGCIGAGSICGALLYAKPIVTFWTLAFAALFSGFVLLHSTLILGIKRFRHLKRSPWWALTLFTPLYPIVTLYLCFARGKQDVPFASGRGIYQKTYITIGSMLLLSLVPWAGAASENIPVYEAVDYFKMMVAPPPLDPSQLPPGGPPPNSNGQPPAGGEAYTPEPPPAE